MKLVQKLSVVALCLGASTACESTGGGSTNPSTEPSIEPRALDDPVSEHVDDGAPFDSREAESPQRERTPAEQEFCTLLASMGVDYFPERDTVEISGWVNMREGLVEVFACAPDGKTHESVIVLDCIPSGLQAGLLALGLEPGAPVELGTEDDYQPPTGDGVLIRVRWSDESGKLREQRAEDWIWNVPEDRSMKHGAWIFAGSFMQSISEDAEDSTFAANYVKSLATTYHDATSILENPHSAGIDDTVYYANPRSVPAVSTPVTAIFTRATR